VDERAGKRGRLGRKVGGLREVGDRLGSREGVVCVIGRGLKSSHQVLSLPAVFLISQDQTGCNIRSVGCKRLQVTARVAQIGLQIAARIDKRGSRNDN
jgi:hypothetical protein